MLISNTFWAFISQIAYIFIGLVSNIVLARFLSPQDFGVIGIAMFFVGISNVLVESGMGGALVRKGEPTKEDFSTMFIFNLGISVILFIFFVFLSEFIANIYSTPDLKYVIIGLSFTLILNAFSLVPSVKLVRNMEFKKMGLYKFISLAIASIVGISMAFLNFGLWSIVTMQILSPCCLMLIYRLKESNRENLVFSIKSFRELFSFGVYTTVTSLIVTVFDNVYQLIIARLFSVHSAGFFYQARRLQEVLDGPTKNVIYNPVYSFLSKLQTEPIEFQENLLKIVKWLAIIVSTITCLTFLFSEQIILLLYGNKWLNSAGYLKFICIASFFGIMEIAYSNLFRIFNKTRYLLYLELFKKIIQIITITFGIIYNSIDILLYGLISTSAVGYILAFKIAMKFNGISISKSQISFLIIISTATITTLILMLIFNVLNISSFYKLPFSILFMLLNISFLYMLKVEDFFQLLKSYFKRNLNS